MRRKKRKQRLPRDPSDPTGLKRLRDSANSAVRSRFLHIGKFQRELVNKLPRSFKNVPRDKAPGVRKQDMRKADLRPNARQYTWLVDDILMDQTADTLRQELRDILLGGSDRSTRRWFFLSYLDRAAGRGAQDSLRTSQLIVPTNETLQDITPEMVLADPAFQARTRLLHGRVFEEMKGLTESMVSTMRRTLTNAMGRGVGISDIRGMLNKNVGVDLVRAERIARTEINKAYTDAYLDESQAINEEILEDDDEEIKVMHFSALSPTTRLSHAERHAHLYTQAEQKEWWDSGSNRINCLCTTIDVLVDKKTGEPFDPEFVRRAKKEGEKFFAAHTPLR